MSTSPFTTKLGTNYCPTGEELLEIRAIIAERTLRLERLDNEITKLQKTMRELVQARDSLRACVAAHNALTSPIRRVPLEIIQEIFLACLPTDGKYSRMKASEGPLLLSSICSLWRTISLATPRLWSKLHVSQPDLSVKIAQRLELTRTWFGRSGQSPLSISYLCRSHIQESYPDSCLFMEIFIKFSVRWQHISFVLPPLVLQLLEGLTEVDAPILKSFRFSQHFHDMPHQQRHWARFGFFRGPLFSQFTVPAHLFRPQDMQISWNRLTMLIVEPSMDKNTSSIHVDVMLAVISRCPNLRVCQLWLATEPSFDSSTHPPFALPFLHTLDLLCLSSVPWILALLSSRLSLPGLTSLTIHGQDRFDYRQPEPPHDSYLPHFFASFAALENLRIIMDNTFSKPFVSSLFRHLPATLQKLHVGHSLQRSFSRPLDDDVFSILTPQGTEVSETSREFCCPRLQELQIDRCFSLSEAVIVQFITARANSPCTTPLRRVHIDFERARMAHAELAKIRIVARLRPLIKAGLVANFVSH